jgi:3',5'-cyclic AMP phosphodiesterase CpdA
MLIAQITDSHCVAAGKVAYSGQVETNAMLERAVNRLNALDPRPDVVIHTGDLADHGQAEEYAEFARIMARLEIPFYVMIGNHDDRPTLLASLSADYS